MTKRKKTETTIEKDSRVGETQEKTKRITLDIPVAFHGKLKVKAKSLGQSMKGYLLWLARQDMKDTEQ